MGGMGTNRGAVPEREPVETTPEETARWYLGEIESYRVQDRAAGREMLRRYCAMHGIEVPVGGKGERQ